MSEASYAVSSFLGGEISAFAQGRFDKPDYRVSLKICLNAFPAEIGTWVRRPGTRHGGITRAGSAGRVSKFDFEQSNAITLEYTDGSLRFRSGVTLLDSNDSQIVVAVSSANPAVVQTTSATNWATGDTLIFPGASTPLLENRQFLATKIDTTHFSLADALTDANIDGSTLGALVAGARVTRVQALATPYTGGIWAGLRPVQAETTDILLAAAVAPQALTVTTLPSAGVNPIFAIAPAKFTDGPYLDPIKGGATITPSGTTGIVTLTIAFTAYDSTRAYSAGDFALSSGTNYQSLIDANLNNTPVSSPAAWVAVNPGIAVGPNGFVGTDVGRLIRLFSEPALWAVGTVYAAGNVVSYVDVNGGTTYYTCLANNTAALTNAPGVSLTNWSINANGATWSWGKITGLANQISQSLAGATNIGTLKNGGVVGLNGFDGITVQQHSAAPFDSTGQVTPATFSGYLGRNYSGASTQVISSATVFPSSDLGLCDTTNSVGPDVLISNIVLTLRAKQTAPASHNDGTSIGQTILQNNTFAAVSIVSTDQVTAWNYVWVDIVVNYVSPTPQVFVASIAVAELQFFNPPGTAAASVTCQLIGPSLNYTTPIRVWRLGVYSNTTGFPTCGVYNDGRLYLGGAVGNRFDACVSNGIVGGTVNFAPTDQFGVVSAASAIAYIFNSKGTNLILWMRPDLQGIKAGTQAGEWLIQAPTAGSISPLNITARQVTSHGSANIEPIDTEHTLIFVQRFAKKLLEYFPDVFSGKFSAPNLADKAQHITRAGVAEMAYTSAVTPIIWGRDLVGALFGITYKRDSLASSQPATFYGWHRHALGSGRSIESICAGPSVGGDLDALTMVTNDAVSNIRHVEILTDTPDELSALAASWFLDDAVNPTSTSTTNNASLGRPYGGLTINGLWHLNGTTVQVFAGGLDCGDPGEGKPIADFVVTNGSVTVPYGDSISAGSGRGLFTAAFAASLPLTQIVVGYTYNSDGQLVRPILQADTGARNGPAFGKLTRAHRYAMKLVNTLGLSIGGTFAKLRPANFKTGTTPLPPLTAFNGISQEALNDDDDYDNGVCFRVSRPFPANLVAIGLNLSTKDQ